jgi:cytochrome P450
MTDTSVIYDPFAPGFAQDPYPHYAALRHADPVHESPFGVWLLFGYHDVQRFLRDSSLSVEERHARPTPLTELARQAVGDAQEQGSYAMLNRDPPDHTRLRRLVSKAFTPRTVERLRPWVTELVDQALEPATRSGGLELIGELAFPLPFTVISTLLGMPDTDTNQLREWSGLLVRSLEPVVDTDTLKKIAAAGQSMRALVGDAIAFKRGHLADDLLSGLIAAEEDGDVLSDDELADQVILLYIAGHETTVNLIGNGTLGPGAQSPPARAAAVGAGCRSQRRRGAPALRQPGADVTAHHRRSRRGGRKDDPPGHLRRARSGFGQPRRLGVRAQRRLPRRGPSRRRTAPILRGGHHLCLGAALARLEGRIALAAVARRFESIELDGEPTWNGRINLRGLDHLPLRVRPAPGD